MPEDEVSPLPPPPDDASGEAPSAPTPVAKAFLCPHCHKGRLDPAGKRPGEDVACPLCGRTSKVTLEHTLGEVRASRREQLKAKARKSFSDLTDEEQAEEIQQAAGVNKAYYFLYYHLGPKGMVVMYLGLVVLGAGGVIGYLLATGQMVFKFDQLRWYHWLIPVGGAMLGALGWFVHATTMHYLAKRKAAQRAADPRRASRRRTLSARNRPPG